MNPFPVTVVASFMRYESMPLVLYSNYLILEITIDPLSSIDNLLVNPYFDRDKKICFLFVFS